MIASLASVGGNQMTRLGFACNPTFFNPTWRDAKEPLALGYLAVSRRQLLPPEGALVQQTTGMK